MLVHELITKLKEFPREAEVRHSFHTGYRIGSHENIDTFISVSDIEVEEGVVWIYSENPE